MVCAESDLRGALKNPNGSNEPVGNDNVAGTENNIEEEPEPVDYQLERGLDLLRGLALYNQDDVPAVTGEIAGDEKIVEEKMKEKNKESK